MPRRFQTPIPDHLREPHEVNVPGLWNVYILGIAMFLGLASGGLLIAWRLLVARFVD